MGDDMAKPCPFCGSTDIVMHEKLAYYSIDGRWAALQCNECAIYGPKAHHHEVDPDAFRDEIPADLRRRMREMARGRWDRRVVAGQSGNLPWDAPMKAVSVKDILAMKALGDKHGVPIDSPEAFPGVAEIHHDDGTVEIVRIDEDERGRYGTSYTEADRPR